MSDHPLLVAGLGNPGGTYARHRHNAGFMALDAMHESYGFSPWRKRFEGAYAEGVLSGRKVLLLKPMTYMNDSGHAVGAAARFFKLPIEAVVVIHDEIDLAAGKLRTKTGGGDAGHNGLRSITATLGPNYRRVRIGVGHPGEKDRVHGHVLQDFSAADRTWIEPLLSAIAQAAPHLAKNDDAGFMTKVSLILNPPVKKPMPEKKDAEKKDSNGI